MPFDHPLLHLAASGGPVVVVLLVLSVTALAIVLLKLWHFRAFGIGAREPVAGALARWREGDAAAALARLEGSAQPVASLLAVAIRGVEDPGVGESTVREELTRIANLHLERLRGKLKTLEVIAAVSPLLGLLGTVLGMIEAFRQMELSGSQVDPATLSGGIWQALLTTAVGLGVAIPALLAHNWFERRVEKYRHFMEDAVTQVFTRPLRARVAVARGPGEGARP